MNAWLHGVNASSAPLLLDHVWPMLWQSSLLIVLVALAGRTLFRKASPQLRYALWGLVLIRLVVPPWVDLPTALGHWGMPEMRQHVAAYVPLDAAAPAATAILQRPLVGGFSPALSNSVTDGGAQVLSAVAPPSQWSLALLVIGLWVLGVASLLLLLLARLFRMHRQVKRGAPAPAWIGQAVARYRTTLGVRLPVRVRLVPGNQSPALMGLLRPTILLPQGALENLREDQLRAVLAHEIAHVKRWDFVVNWAQVLLGIAYFFHPLLWFANREMRRERELACDDLTLITLGLNREGYAESLLRVAEGLSTVRRLAPVQVGVMEGELELARRLRRILDQKIRPVPRLTVLSLGIVLVFAAVFGTWHFAVVEPTVEAAVAEEEVERRSLEVKVVNEAGEPVEGALVTPTFLRSSSDPGSSYGWREDFGRPGPAKSNADGIATVSYPRYVLERQETDVVAVIARHPDYAAGAQVELKVDGSSPALVMEAGATLRVSGHLGDAPNAATPLFALLSGTPIGEWQSLDKGKLQRSDLLSGPHRVLLIHKSKDGSLFFSDSHEFEARKGVISEFTLPLQRGVRLSGRLSGSVPRPVKDGWVEVRIRPASQVGAGKYPQGSVEWTAQAEVDEDGSFVLENLPKGHGEITAACEGAVSMGEPWPDMPSVFGAPVVTTLDREANEVAVSMIASATAIVRVTGPDANPVAGATVSLWPNVQYFEQYSTIFGMAPFNSVEGLGLTQEEMMARWMTNRAHEGTTDDTGVATTKNLPPWAAEFTVRSETLELSPNEQQRRQRSIELHPGESTEVTAQLVAKGTDALGADTPAPPAAAAPKKPTPAGLAAAIATEREKANADPFALPTTPASPANRFEGKVVDESGNPLAGVRVDAWTWCPGEETDTDADGGFVLDGFDADQNTIEVRIAKEGYSPVHMFRQPLGALVAPVVLTTRTYLEGIVTDSAGKPVAGALIRADAGPRDAEGGYLGETITSTQSGADGTYHFPVQHGTYTVSVVAGLENATLKEVAVAQYEAKRLDIQVRPGAVFRAVVIDSVTKKPVEGVRLANWRREEFEGVSDASGNIEIAGMPEGPFEFDVHGDALGITRWWSEDAVNEHEREYIRTDRNWQRNFDDLTFNIAPGMEAVTIIAEQGARVHGTVLDPDGNPVAGATVAPALTGTSNSLTGDTRFSVTTNEQGAFDMLLPASKIREYNLIAHDGDYEEWRTWANGVMDPISTRPGDVMENVEIRLQHPCVIRGKAVDDAGNPLVDREVRAAAKAQNDNRYYVPTTRTDAEGNFELKFVAPGEHYVQAAPFWLDPTEAPEGSTQVVAAAVDAPVKGVTLVRKREE